jgi:ACS family hexuronate transporter-like MFS transporter
MRSPSWKWLFCGLLLAATMLNYMDRQTLSQGAARIMGEFRLDERQYGQLESAFAFAFAVGAIIFGWMADRWNVTLLYPLAVLVWSAAGFATGLVQGFVGLLLCRSLLGLAEAGNWPCALRATQHVLPSRQRSLGNAILQCGAAFGAIFTPMLYKGMVVGGEAGAWRPLFMIIGAGGITWVLVWVALVRSRDLAIERRASPSLIGIVGWLGVLLGLDIALQLAQVRYEALATPLVTIPVKLGVCGLGVAAVVRWLFASTRADDDGETLAWRDFVRRFWVLLVLVVSINVPWHFFRAWLPLFLQKGRGYTEESTADFSTYYYIATDAGSLAAGFAALMLARRGLTVHGSRVVVFAACAALVALSVLAALLGSGLLLLALLLVIGAGALGVFPIYYTLSQELTTRHQGKLTGALGCINWLAMYALHALVGESVKATGKYDLGVGLAGLAPLVGLAVLLFFWKPSATERLAKS